MAKMRYFFSFVVLLLSFSFSFAGIVEKTYHFASPQIQQTGNYNLIIFPGTMQSALAGNPSLPYMNVDLVLPVGEKAVSIKFTGSDETFLDGSMILYPYQEVSPVFDAKASIEKINKKIYLSNSVFPETPEGHLITSHLYGHSIAQSSFTPVRYIPAEGKVSYFKTVTIEIITEADPQSSTVLMNLKTDRFSCMQVEKLVQNKEAVVYSQTDAPANTDDYDLLILTTETYAGGFADLTKAYLRKGIISKVETLENIGYSISGIDIQDKIRNYIIQEYQNNNIKYVLLGGDDELVPHRGFYCEVQSSSLYTDYDIPSDIYFSSLDGNWNTDGDDKWAEPGEDDLLPEVAVARMPFSNPEELENMIHKTVMYQFSPVGGELRKMIFAGEELYSSPYTVGSQYLELLIGDHSDNGYSTVGIPETYTFDKMYDEILPWSGVDLRTHLNEGSSMLHHVGHANETYVMKFSYWDINNGNFPGLNGLLHNYPIVYTHGCLCGAFDTDDCIAEKMVTIDNFASAFVGNSRYGWFNEGQTEGPSAHLHREYVDALFGDNINNIGAAHAESKRATASFVTAPGQWEPGAIRWCFYDCNVLGDPAMAIYTNYLRIISVNYDEAIPVGTESLDVLTTESGIPAGNVTCVVLLHDQLIGKAISGSNGYAHIVFDSIVSSPDTAELVISGFNIRPKTFDLFFTGNALPVIELYEQTIMDPAGNQNNQADYGENISLRIGLLNSSEVDDPEVQTHLIIDDPFVTLTDNTEDFGAIPAGLIVFRDNAFSIKIADSIPDGHMVNCTLEAVSGSKTDISYFQIQVNAPILNAGSLEIDDSQGNNNGRLDPGELVTLRIYCTNNGHAAGAEATAELGLISGLLQLNSDEDALGIINAGESKIAEFSATVDPQANTGDFVMLTFNLSSGDYSTSKDYSAYIGLIVEDFESGDYNVFHWLQGLQNPWIIDEENYFEGDFSSRSGVIGNNENTTMSISIEVTEADSLSFYCKTSSQSDADFFGFEVDNISLLNLSGEREWTSYSYYLTAGLHTLTWKYSKDASISSGSDAAWVDFIIFPPFRYILGVNQADQQVDFTLAPVPAHDFIGIRIPDHAAMKYSLFTMGMSLVKEGNLQDLPVLNDAHILDLMGLKPSVYILQLEKNGVQQSRKFVVQ